MCTSTTNHSAKRWLFEINPLPFNVPSLRRLKLMWWAVCLHDDVIKWKNFPRYWPFVRGLSKEWRRRWFETPSPSLWRQCNVEMARNSKVRNQTSWRLNWSLLRLLMLWFSSIQPSASIILIVYVWYKTVLIKDGHFHFECTSDLTSILQKEKILLGRLNPVIFSCIRDCVWDFWRQVSAPDMETKTTT